MDIFNQINLTTPEHAYFFGFVQGDGHLSRSKRQPNKGKLTVELSVRDKDILFQFQRMFPESSISYRHRTTNFSDDYDSVIWRMCRQEFREQLETLGVPTGKKSLIVAPPKVSFSTFDYWRGFIDADGSLGLTIKGLPYLSLVTASQHMAVAYESLIFDILGKHKALNRNKRDSVYNITLFREDAIQVIRVLYYEGCLALNRKLEKAKEAIAWVRPANMRIVVGMRDWTKEEDEIVLSYGVEEASVELKRSISSIKNRRFRLSHRAKDSDHSAEGAA